MLFGTGLFVDGGTVLRMPTWGEAAGLDRPLAVAPPVDHDEPADDEGGDDQDTDHDHHHVDRRSIAEETADHSV
jgi:hypothetical protein